MGAAETTMEARLAASRARLNLSIEQMKKIEERSKSTDATLARIARLQASWEPTEQGVQEGRERRRESLTRQMEITGQAVARISGVKASTLTSSSATHHDIPSKSPTKSSTLDLSPKSDEVGIQIPDAVAESTPAGAASALAAPLLLMDRMEPTMDQNMALHLDAPKVFEEIPMSRDTTSVGSKMFPRYSMTSAGKVLGAAATTTQAEATLARRQQLLPRTVAQIACSQLVGSKEIMEEKKFPSPSSGGFLHSGQDVGDTALLPQDPFMCVHQEAAAGVTYKLLSEEPPKHVRWDDEICDDVITHVGSMSLFWELGLALAEDVCAERIPRDIASDEEIADTVLTHVGDWSLFIQHDMVTCPEFQDTCHAENHFDHGVGLTKLPLSTCYTQGFSNIGSRFTCRVLDNNIFVKNIAVSFLNWLLHLYISEDGKSTFLEFEVYVQWDPGIIDNALLSAMFIQLAQKSVDLLLLYIQVIKELYNGTMAGHTTGYSMHNLIMDSIAWLGGQGLVAESRAVWEITNNEVTYWSGAVQLPLCLKLAIHATDLNRDSLQTGDQMVFSTVYQFWPLGSSINEKNDMSWHRQVQKEPCKCRNLSSFLGVSSDLEYKQWDPGGIHNRSRIRAIAWGQEMFCRGGSVTPDVHPGLGFGCWWQYMGLAQLVNTWSSKDKWHERALKKASKRK